MLALFFVCLCLRVTASLSSKESKRISSCGLEFQKTYGAKCMRLHVFISDTSDASLTSNVFLAHLPDTMTALVHVILIEYGDMLSVDALGRYSDEFLTSRPHWTVYHEDFAWSKHRSNHMIYIRANNLDVTLEAIGAMLNPPDCSSKYLVFRGYNDFDEYGNEHYNIANFFNYVRGSIPIVHINLYAKFIDDGYCPSQPNKHLCAFLPMTSCPMPTMYLNCSIGNPECTPGNMVFEGAFPEAKVAFTNYDSKDFRDKLINPNIPPAAAVGRLYLSRKVFDFDEIVERKISEDLTDSMFFTSVFMRRNYDFRARTAKLVHTARYYNTPAMMPTDSCVAIHIRHHDRIKAGFDMIKYCEEFVRRPDGTCYNRTNNEPIEPDCANRLDAAYGCGHAIPYGGITFDMYLRAAEVLLNATGTNTSSLRRVFIMTDDGEWVNEEKKRFKDSWIINVMPAEKKHRSRATINGVTLFASIELMQHCSAMVGHTGSAFTNLVRSMMCVRHGPKNSIRFGECPPFFDFRYTGEGHGR